MAERGLRRVALTRAGYGSSSRHRGRTVAEEILAELEAACG